MENQIKTVSDLIKALSNFPPKTPVFVAYNQEYRLSELTSGFETVEKEIDEVVDLESKAILKVEY